MRAVVQRVTRAQVTIGGEVAGEIGAGFLVLLGIGTGDHAEAVGWLADKILHLRVFPNEDGKFDRSLLDTGGEMLVVSQFTLFADTRRGRRPAFTGAARPEEAIPLYEAFVERIRAAGVSVATGRFGADMQVELINDGPVTIPFDSQIR